MLETAISFALTFPTPSTLHLRLQIWSFWFPHGVRGNQICFRIEILWELFFVLSWGWVVQQILGFSRVAGFFAQHLTRLKPTIIEPGSLEKRWLKWWVDWAEDFETIRQKIQIWLLWNQTKTFLQRKFELGLADCKELLLSFSGLRIQIELINFIFEIRKLFDLLSNIKKVWFLLFLLLSILLV